ncbi:MAG TPA: hypothetical protein PL131_05475 [Methylotenera sp.]|nr:hypothetical protein [Methylotenera sp.]HPH05305.1 hypothetical protein [Methylotenera sp.]HPN00207.1 hypothetical protein [Methylotenera sp.]
MGKFFIGVISLIFVFVFTQAHADDVSYLAIEKTPLKLKNIDQYGKASFSGSILIDGDYQVGLGGYDDEPLKPKVLFYPNPTSMNFLPTPHSSSPGYDTPPDVILFTNGDKAAKLLLSSSEYKELMKQKKQFDNYTLEEKHANHLNLKTFRGAAQLKIDRYTTAIECDSRWYSARLISLHKKRHQSLAEFQGNLPC